MTARLRPWINISLFIATLITAQCLPLGLPLGLPLACFAQVHDHAPATTSSLFAKSNLVAWCIVPFDAKHRTPTQRAEMLKKLGISKLAYDWRDQHIASFEDEILSLKKQGIEFFAHWTPTSQSPGYQPILELIEKYKLHPQLWMIAPSAPADTQEKQVAINAKALLPYVKDAKRLGCKFGIYNHGGWAGEPENMIAIVKWLRTHAKTDDVGIVYNFHHGHEHLARFPKQLNAMVPYLICLNLNGMTMKGPKILPLSQGKEDLRVLTMVRDSGYRGPIGILDHRADTDAEISLQQNLDGLHKLLLGMGETAAAQTYTH